MSLAMESSSFFDLALEVAQVPAQRSRDLRARPGGQSIGLAGAIFDQLGPSSHELLQLVEGRIESRRRCRVEEAAIVSQGLGIDLIGLGQKAASPGKIARQARVNDTHGHARIVQAGHETPMVRPGRLADDMDGHGHSSQAFEQDAITGRGIGDGRRQRKARCADNDGVLGDVSAEVDRRQVHG